MVEPDVSLDQKNSLLTYTSKIVSAFAANNTISQSELNGLIASVYKTLASLKFNGSSSDSNELKPAVPIRRSVTPEYIICLEDGQKLKMLKRYLRTNYDLSPEEYRAKWNLPHDYPMVSPNYAKQRSDFAKTIGLGKSSGKK